MSNDYLDLLKLKNKELGKTEKSGVNDLINLNKHQLNLMNAKYGLLGKKEDNSLTKNIAGTLQSIIGNSPRKGGVAFAQGFVNGLQMDQGNDDEALAKKKQDYQQVFDYFEKNIGALEKQNQINAQSKSAQEKVIPEAMYLAQYMDKIPYDDVSKQASNIVNQYNNQMNTDYKIKMIDQATGKILLDSPSGDKNIIDLYDLFPDVRRQKTLSELEAKALETAELNRERADAKLALSERMADQNMNIANERLDVSRERNRISGQNAQAYQKQIDAGLKKMDAQEIKEIAAINEKKIEPNRILMEDIESAREIAKRNSGIFQSMKAYAWSKNDPGYLDLFIRGLTNASDQDKKDIGEFQKAISRMLQFVTKGLVKQNIFIEKGAEKSIPNFNLPAASILKVLNSMENDAKRSIKNGIDEINFLGTGGAKAYGSHITQEAQDRSKKEVPPPPEMQEQMPAKQQDITGRVLIKMPDGSEWYVKPEKLEAIKKRGGVVLQ